MTYPASLELTKRINRTPYRESGVTYTGGLRLLNVGASNPEVSPSAAAGTETGVTVGFSVGVWGIVQTATPGFTMDGLNLVVSNAALIAFVDDYAEVTITSYGFAPLVVRVANSEPGAATFALVAVNIQSVPELVDTDTVVADLRVVNTEDGVTYGVSIADDQDGAIKLVNTGTDLYELRISDKYLITNARGDSTALRMGAGKALRMTSGRALRMSL